MVCSSCAFDNPPGMRFCGMCGTPLPHKPMTAPGAHSTINLTRVPLDVREAAAGREQPRTSRQAVALERPPEYTSVAAPEPPKLDTPTPASAAMASEPPTRELVPDVPLDEYVKSFSYEPPLDAAEITMRGDEAVANTAPPPSTATAEKGPDGPEDTLPPNGNASAAPEDVDQRLGLEPESAAESRIARPRFLDINEPARPGRPLAMEAQAKQPSAASAREPAGPATTIGGPSFLGLNDPPQNWAEAVGVERGEYAPRRSHWRVWSALFVVLLFGFLGYLEWRAQVHQTYDGPVEVIRTKFHSLKQAVLAQLSEPPPPGSVAKPKIQGQPQPATSNAQPAEAQSPAGGTPAAENPQPVNKIDLDNPQQAQPLTPAPGQNAAPPPASEAPKPTSDNSAQKPAPEKGATAANRSTAPPAAKAASDATSSSAAKPVPGAEEMAKANDASDSAATAAWLWKATAKGNPEAPVQLANMYVEGNGVPRSCEQAVVLLKTAADKDNVLARNRLGSMYATGTCVPLDRVAAYRWYSAALKVNPDSPWTQQTRNAIWQQMSPEERAQAQKYK